MNAIRNIANEYRRETGRQFGYVIVHDAEAAGWACALDNPGGWEPGCIAVDEKGRQWEAKGGNNYDGAERWEAVVQPCEKADEQQR